MGTTQMIQDLLSCQGSFAVGGDVQLLVRMWTSSGSCSSLHSIALGSGDAMTNPALMEPEVQQERQLKRQQPHKGTSRTGSPPPNPKAETAPGLLEHTFGLFSTELVLRDVLCDVL